MLNPVSLFFGARIIRQKAGFVMNNWATEFRLKNNLVTLAPRIRGIEKLLPCNAQSYPQKMLATFGSVVRFSTIER
ncbi:hypothetical protein A9Q99_08075 [Gammaproteobacteria bacterium 45_16_T64]|nr:hypothetical protein A9Q99_08075 [Gammaproteobacteria bacterium 45_16_T64]